MTRRLIALASAALMFLALTVPAATAAKPDIFTDEWVDNWYIGECDGFSILTEDNMEVTTKFFYNKDGSVDRIHFHFVIEGIVYNSAETWKSLTGVSHYNAVTDESFEVWPTSGLFYRVDLPQGVVLVDAGRFVVDVSSGEPVYLWQAGNHQIIDEDFDDLCAALS